MGVRKSFLIITLCGLFLIGTGCVAFHGKKGRLVFPIIEGGRPSVGHCSMLLGFKDPQTLRGTNMITVWVEYKDGTSSQKTTFVTNKPYERCNDFFQYASWRMASAPKKHRPAAVKTFVPQKNKQPSKVN